MTMLPVLHSFRTAAARVGWISTVFGAKWDQVALCNICSLQRYRWKNCSNNCGRYRDFGRQCNIPRVRSTPLHFVTTNISKIHWSKIMPCIIKFSLKQLSQTNVHWKWLIDGPIKIEKQKLIKTTKHQVAHARIPIHQQAHRRNIYWM